MMAMAFATYSGEVWASSNTPSASCPASLRPVQNLGQGKLSLEDGHVIAKPRSAILGGEGMRKPRQPFPHQGVDLVSREAVAELFFYF